MSSKMTITKAMKAKTLYPKGQKRPGDAFGPRRDEAETRRVAKK